jgi:hypothetical protein
LWRHLVYCWPGLRVSDTKATMCKVGHLYHSILKGKWWNHAMAWLHWSYFRAHHQDCHERLWRVWGYYGRCKGSSWPFQQ